MLFQYKEIMRLHQRLLFDIGFDIVKKNPFKEIIAKERSDI